MWRRLALNTDSRSDPDPEPEPDPVRSSLPLHLSGDGHPRTEV